MNTTNTNITGAVSNAVGNLNTTRRVSAVFDTRDQAERAVSELRSLGVNDSQLSVIVQHDNTGASATADATADAGRDVATGTLAGAGVGALFGIAAALIPGVGPFITAGTLLSSALGAVGGGAVAGAIVGGTTGLIGSALARAGYSEHEATYYGERVERGAVLVVVDTSNLNDAAVRDVLSRNGGGYAPSV